LTSILGQDISAQIKDSKTQLPIQYANIGIVGKNIGTVSDSLGDFKLSLTNVLDIDTLRISIIAYKTKNYKVGDLRNSEFPKTVLMDESIVQLNEIIINNQNGKPFQLGLKKKYGYPIPLYKGVQSKVAFPQKGYRHEIGTRFTNSKIMSLDSIQLNFAECNVDEINLRLNVYSIQEGRFENILSQPIYITLNKKEALDFPIINLVKHTIEIDSDFLVTIENYKKMGDGALYILANFKSRGRKYPTYYRHSSQSNWIKHRSKKSKTFGISILAFGH
jgi:hypothetical protein